MAQKFEITPDLPSNETIEAIDDVENGRDLSGPYRSREALREALDT